MVEWQSTDHRLNGHEFEQTLGDNEGQGSTVCCSPWGCKESDMTQQLNNNNHIENYELLSRITEYGKIKSDARRK